MVTQQGFKKQNYKQSMKFGGPEPDINNNKNNSNNNKTSYMIVGSIVAVTDSNNHRDGGGNDDDNTLGDGPRLQHWTMTSGGGEAMASHNGGTETPKRVALQPTR